MKKKVFSVNNKNLNFNDTLIFITEKIDMGQWKMRTIEGAIIKEKINAKFQDLVDFFSLMGKENVYLDFQVLRIQTSVSIIQAS